MGSYTFSTLPPATYDLTISVKGFRTLVQKDIPITPNIVRREELTLEVGQVNETVTVEAGAVSLQTDKADVHTEIGSKEIVNIPLPHYRNYQSLINLVPGTTPGQYQNSIQAAPARALSINVNGVNRNNNATRIDGALSVFLWLPHHTAYIPPAETIETVNIATNNFDAEQGLAGGAAITVVTKSGTNDLHGSAWAFHDNAAVQAKNFFNTAAKPKNIDNIDGVTAGRTDPPQQAVFLRRLGRHARTAGRESASDGSHGRPAARRFLAITVPSIYDPRHGRRDRSGPDAVCRNIIPLARQSSISRKDPGSDSAAQSGRPERQLPGQRLAAARQE